MFLHGSIHVMPFWPENMGVTLCSVQRVLSGGTEVQSRYCSLWSFPVVKVVSPWESAVFPFVISKSLGGVGIFLKSPLSNSEVSQGRDRMTEIHQNGRSRGCFCQKIWPRSGRSEGRCSVIESPEGSEQFWNMCCEELQVGNQSVWRNVSDWIEGSRTAWILVNQLAVSRFHHFFSSAQNLEAEVEKVFSKGHSALFRGGGDLELWAPAALKHAVLGQVTRLRSPVDY